MMRNGIACTVVSALSLLAASAVAQAADIESVKVVFDPGVSSRTNMGRLAGETSELRVTFDPGVMARTNVYRAPEEAQPLRISRDDGLMKRTNMGGSARPAPIQETAQAR